MNNWFKKCLIYSGLFVLGIIGIKYFFIYFSPFVIAAVLASLIDPVVNYIEKRLSIKRGLATLFVLILLISILISLLIFGFAQIYLELNRLLKNLPDYTTFGNQLQWLLTQNTRLQTFIDELDISPAVKEALNENLQLLYNGLKNGLIILINNTLNLLRKLPLFFVILFLSFIATFFLSKDKDKINNFILGLFPVNLRTKVFNVEKELSGSLIGFIRAELILISITGVICWVGLMILGNPYALIIGITAAILDLIPIIGPTLIFIPWVIYSIFAGNFSFGISLLIVYTLMAAVRQGAEGKVMGSNLGFHPLIIMIALYVGYRTMGTIGFIVGPTVLVVTKAIVHAGIITTNKNFKE